MQPPIPTTEMAARVPVTYPPARYHREPIAVPPQQRMSGVSGDRSSGDTERRGVRMGGEEPSAGRALHQTSLPDGTRRVYAYAPFRREPLHVPPPFPRQRLHDCAFQTTPLPVPRPLMGT